MQRGKKATADHTSKYMGWNGECTWVGTEQSAYQQEGVLIKRRRLQVIDVMYSYSYTRVSRTDSLRWRGSLRVGSQSRWLTRTWDIAKSICTCRRSSSLARHTPLGNSYLKYRSDILRCRKNTATNMSFFDGFLLYPWV